jgi:hypothetical protein
MERQPGVADGSRSNAPSSPRAFVAEASRRIRSLYSAVNRRRLARSTTSDDARPSGGAAAAPRSLDGLAGEVARAEDVEPPELRNNVTLFDFLILDFQLAPYTNLGPGRCLTLVGTGGPPLSTTPGGW